MYVKAALVPVFVLVALTLGAGAALGFVRAAAVRRGDVKLKDVALRQDLWPDRVRQIGASYHNQLETPPLFYVLVAFAVALNEIDAVFVALEWAYVAARVVHAYVHLTSNYVPARFFAFVVSMGLLAAAWIYFAVRVLSG